MVKKRLIGSVAFVAIMGAAGCVDEPDVLERSVGGGTVHLTGAIFTTTVDGDTVDGNIYEEFCDVYLNGGPAHEGAAGLPEGDYYFMVTSPSGGPPSELLSTDAVELRQFHVDDTGTISGLSGAGDHDTSENLIDGGVTIQLCPFLPTPNPGCEFKAWVTRVEDYDLDAPGAIFGFKHSDSKTDNFKVCEEEPEEPCPDPEDPPREPELE